MAIDFDAATARLRALTSDVVEIDIDASAITVTPAHRPTLLERLRAASTRNELNELITLTLEESK